MTQRNQLTVDVSRLLNILVLKTQLKLHRSSSIWHLGIRVCILTVVGVGYQSTFRF